MNSVNAEIITIGDEILYGHITDTNSQWLSHSLSEAGFNVKWKTTVGDDDQEILKAFSVAEERAAVVLTTGGLGPTKDDRTITCLAKHFGKELYLNEQVLDNIKQLYFSKGRELNKYSYRQATIPHGSQAIHNEHGTAPGLLMARAGKPKIFVALPGVPHEMQKMMNEVVIPSLRERFETPTIKHTMIKTIGAPETQLSELLENWEAALPPHIQLAYLPRLNQVRIRLTVKGSKPEVVEQETQQAIESLQALVGEYIYAVGEQDLAATIGELLKQSGQSLATAESCTGGLVADSLTNINGCSAWYQGGIVAYSNKIKQSQLGIDARILETHGAVSAETAKAMAENVRERYGADFGISTTGIAGPSGGVPGKPVGTVYIGLADAHGSFTKHLHISEDRLININYSTNAVLEMLRKHLISGKQPSATKW